MLFTVCIALFSSLTAVDATEDKCFRVTAVQVQDLTAQCKLIDSDPLATCETQRSGALKYFIRIRRLAGDASEAPLAAKKEEV